jgi:hypothetical protein
MWVKPELTVLVRSRPEEMVLAGCKSWSGTWTNSGASHAICIRLFCGSSPCSGLGTS